MSNEVVSRARAGDKQAFAQLYEQHKDKLYRYAYFQLGNAQDAQDAVSDCMVEAYSGIAQLKSEKAFGSWIFQILYRVCCKALNKKINRREMENIDERPALTLEEPHLAPELEEALAILKPEDKKIVLLSVVAGYKTREIAEMMHLNHATVRSRLSRALAKMKTFLE